MNNAFGFRLRDLRKERKLSQECLGSKLGLQRATISAYEHSLIVPPYDKIKWFADYFNVSVDWLIGVSNIREKDDSLEVKDLYKRLDEMYMELSSESMVVMLKGKELTKNEKALLLPMIQSALNVAKLMEK